MRSFLILFSFFISLFIPCQGKQALLTQRDVKEVMNQLFEYHIDKKKISSVILERSLKIYLKQFDPSHAYLLQEEASPFMHPSDPTLNKMLSDYENNHFELYFALDQKIQDSIVRARNWRWSWMQDPHKLIAAAKKDKIERIKEERYATALADLKERHYKRFVDLIAYHLKELKMDCAGIESKVIALCEKQIASMENEYLALNDQNKPLTSTEHEHLVILRTLKSLSHSLDAHTAYYSPDEAYAMKVQLEKGMCGIGVVLREGVDGIMIQDVIAGGPAEQSGEIKPGDTIVEVDGESIRDYSFHRVLDLMKGKEGTKTVLGILRQETSKPEFLRVSLVRSKIVLADQRVDVQAEPFGDGIIGKITLHSFYEGDDGVSSEKDLKKAIDELKEIAPLQGIVLDMRENSGGFLHNR